MGYHRAGFDIWGIDHDDQPRYPFSFIQGDALEMGDWLPAFDIVHASPPCQRFSALNTGLWDSERHPDLIGPTRELLGEWGGPYVIENVPGSPLRANLTLCGSMFGLEIVAGQLRRHRIFESNFDLGIPPACQHRGRALGVYGHGRGGDGAGKGRSASADEARELMGMPWATGAGATQAVPPAYTEYIGRQLIGQL